jgi:signal transduction histidine kinase
MESKYFKKISLFILATLVLAFSAFSAEEAPEKIIKKSRYIIKTCAEPKLIAQAHYDIGIALEKLGRDNEATAEYLKIIVNYPTLSEINRKAEDRLSDLYNAFSERREEPAGEYTIAEHAKDPSIFFSYIKSLYENYRNLGRYDRALYILQKLIDMDPQNQGYMLEVGRIYLNGYNDTDRAILCFKEVLQENPAFAEAYADIGLAYEKKGDYEGALKAYKKCIKASPTSQWAMYAQRRAEGVKLGLAGHLVKDWFFLGPFNNSDKAALKKKFPPEKKINLKLSYKGKDEKKIRWFRPFNYDGSGYVNLNTLFTPNDYAAAYALTYVYSPVKYDVQLRIGSDDGIQLWLNGKEILNYDISRLAEPDEDIINAVLKEGWNEILLKVADTSGAWGFYFRITDRRGNPVKSLVFDPLKDYARLKQVYGKLKMEKRFKFTKIALVYSLALGPFLLGLIFMISNIYNRIRINRMKDDFVSSVSHELKTPLAGIRMFAETLKRDKIKDEVKKFGYYDMIIREADRLTRFVNKILNFSNIEKGGKIYTFEKVDLGALATEAAGIYTDEAQDASLKISVNQKGPLFAHVDKDAFLQVVLNLLDNAYKYSEGEKKIFLNVREEASCIKLEIIDSGVGIPKDKIERIFDRFYRVEAGPAQASKGSGIGLAFVKSIIEAHDGRIAVESSPGKGSKFIISLPKTKNVRLK